MLLWEKMKRLLIKLNQFKKKIIDFRFDRRKWQLMLDLYSFITKINFWKHQKHSTAFNNIQTNYYYLIFAYLTYHISLRNDWNTTWLIWWYFRSYKYICACNLRTVLNWNFNSKSWIVDFFHSWDITKQLFYKAVKKKNL